ASAARTRRPSREARMPTPSPVAGTPRSDSACTTSAARRLEAPSPATSAGAVPRPSGSSTIPPAPAVACWPRLSRFGPRRAPAPPAGGLPPAGLRRHHFGGAAVGTHQHGDVGGAGAVVLEQLDDPVGDRGGVLAVGEPLRHLGQPRLEASGPVPVGGAAGGR